MQFSFMMRPQIIIECPECKSKDVHVGDPRSGPIWCNACNYRVEHKEQDLEILVQGGGTISPLKGV